MIKNIESNVGKNYSEIFKYFDNDNKVNDHIKKILEESNSLEKHWNKVNMSLDNYMDNYTAIGKDSSSITKILGGFNHRNLAHAVPSNKQSQGLAFFTRPQLALHKENLLRDPIFANLLNTNKFSIHRYIRCTLDPRLAYSKTGSALFSRYIGNLDARNEKGAKFKWGSLEDEDLTCPLINNDLLFTPLLTNSLESMSGWPDEQLPYYSSKPNVRGGLVMCADGDTEINGEFDISCTFTNTQDSPILLLLYYWIRYCANVVKGTMLPYPDILYGNELDYTTRIYRLVLDQTNTYVTMIAACGAAFPNATDIGKYFNFDNKKPYGELNRSITVNFKCIGARYFAPRLIDEFNKSTCIGQPNLLHLRLHYLNSSYSLPKDFNMSKIPYNLLEMFNFTGYPFINYYTLELEWWVENDDPRYVAVKDLIARGLDKTGSDMKFENLDAHIYKEKSNEPDKKLKTPKLTII